MEETKPNQKPGGFEDRWKSCVGKNELSEWQSLWIESQSVEDPLPILLRL